MLTRLTESGNLEVNVNVAFSYECFQIAAAKVQNKPEFQNDESVQKLQFTNHWVHALKKRFKQRRI